MPDSIGFKFDTAPFKQFVADRERRMRQAAMYNVREGGRVVKGVAKAKVPVWNDKITAHGYLTKTRGMKLRAYRDGGWQANLPVVGLLRSSIHSAKRLKYDGRTWTLKIGPRGPRAHKYAEKIEHRVPYMADAYAAVSAAMPRISAASYGKVWKEK